MALILFSVLLAGCASRQDKAQTIADQRNWTRQVVTTPTFDIALWAPRAVQPGQDLIVYVESDGLAWLSPYRLSDDPTPTKPLALELAVRDPRPNVAYVARPCQYVQGPQRRNCSDAYWSHARFAEEVVASMNMVVDRLAAAASAQRVELVGYSGGGAVAALLAARRTDVSRLVTVAGVLDHAAWTAADGMTPLFSSLNPADFADRLGSVPQIHLAGGEDDVVPPTVARAYARRFAAGAPLRLVVVPGFGHECCWAERWPTLLRTDFRP